MIFISKLLKHGKVDACVILSAFNLVCRKAIDIVNVLPNNIKIPTSKNRKLGDFCIIVVSNVAE